MTVSPIAAQADELTTQAKSVQHALVKAGRDAAPADVDFARVLKAATGSLTDDSSQGTTTSGTGATGVAGEYDLTGASSLASGADAYGSLTGLSTVDGVTPTSGNDVVADAVQYLGVPYQWGGTDPDTGLDCSGLVQRVYGDLGYTLPRVSSDQANVGTAVDSLADAQPGDLVFFGSPVHHVGIYIGNGQMIEAPHTGEDVRVSTIADFGEPVSHIRRILGDSTLLSANQGTITTASAVRTGAAAYQSIFNAAAARTGVSANLLEAVAQEESGFNPNAVSSAGAEGMMQLMPSTASSLGVSDPFNAEQSINGAASYLRSLLVEFNGNTSLALAAYNAGPAAVAKYGGVPPYAETQKYVNDVESLMET